MKCKTETMHLKIFGQTTGIDGDCTTCERTEMQDATRSLCSDENLNVFNMFSSSYCKMDIFELRFWHPKAGFNSQKLDDW